MKKCLFDRTIRLACKNSDHPAAGAAQIGCVGASDLAHVVNKIMITVVIQIDNIQSLTNREFSPHFTAGLFIFIDGFLYFFRNCYGCAFGGSKLHTCYEYCR